MDQLWPTAANTPGHDICTIPACFRQCFRARTTDLEGTPCSHARVAWIYGRFCTPAMTHAVVTLRWRRCAGYVFMGIKATRRPACDEFHSVASRTRDAPPGHTAKGTYSTRPGAGRPTGSPPRRTDISRDGPPPARDARERVVRRWPTSARYKVSGRGYGGDIRSRGGRASVRGCAFEALRVGGGDRKGKVWQSRKSRQYLIFPRLK